MLTTRRLAVFAVFFSTILLFAQGLWADDWTLTGSGTRVKTVAFIDVNVYDISHYVKKLPAAKTKQAVIELDADKKFVWTMRRDVDKEKIIDAIKNAFAMNGYTDQAKIGTYLSAWTGDLKEKSHVYITYDAAAKAVTVKVDGGGSATIPGEELMKAVWSIWFGKIDQPKLGDQLISKLP
jgi:hypothetical protein